MNTHLHEQMSEGSGTATRVDAVLPLTIRDFERFEILDRSLNAFFSDMGTCWLVLPDRQIDEARRRITSTRYRMIGEENLVPELTLFPKMKGWYRQQLIKLAIARRIETPFYLTLDADVICAKPVSASDLVVGGKAPFYAKDEDLFPDWYQSAESVLRRKPKRTGIFHNVTPAVLSRDGVTALLDHAALLFQTRPLGADRRTARLLYARLRYRMSPGRCDPGRLYLASMFPWTEYALYYTFLESTDLVDRYHQATSTCLYSIDGSVWNAESFAAWDPGTTFSKTGAPYFLVVQSTTGIAPERIWDRVQAHVDSPGKASETK